MDPFLAILMVVGNVLTAAIFGLAGGYMWNKGVIGELRRVKTDVLALESELADFQTRVVKLSKQRAADASTEVRQERKSLVEEATLRLAEESTSDPKKRPSVVSFRRR